MARTHTDWFKVGTESEFPGWNFLAQLDEFTRQALPEGTPVSFAAEVPGGRVHVNTFAEFRSELESEEEFFSLYGWWGEDGVDPLRVSFLYSGRDPRITVEGQDETAVKGTAAVLRGRVDRWLQAKEDAAVEAIPPVPYLVEPTLPEGSPQIQIGRRGWRRLVMNPWVVTIVGGVIVTVVVTLIVS